MNFKHEYYNDSKIFKKSNENYLIKFKEDCKDFNSLPVIFDYKRRVIAIGDIHGDLNSAIQLLIVANVIQNIEIQQFENYQILEKKFMLNEKNQLIESNNFLTSKDIEKQNNKNEFNLVYRYYTSNNIMFVKVVFDNIIKFYKWIGEDTYVVQVGDQIDRCRPFNNKFCKNSLLKDDEDSDLEIMLLYDSLDKLVIDSGKGGRVLSLLGNHEIMNVMGDMRYVSQKSLIEFSELNNSQYKQINKGLENRQNVFKDIISKKMACTRITILIIGNFLFVHGGIIDKLANHYKIIDINTIIRKFLTGHLKYNLKKDKRQLKTLLNSKISPLWYRELGYLLPDSNSKYDKKCELIFNNVIDKINEENFNIQIINNMVIGHTPQFTIDNNPQGINSSCIGRLWKVDIGISKAFDQFSNIYKSPELINKSRKTSVLEILTNRVGDELQTTTNILF